ncbi:putative glucuronosyltransferase [Helianthus annuus]|uniref:Hexosyltransferase n=1 Tax=Helianthus annuus TaxID=4232 RepID=A0A251U7A3_HELAN|nr:inositol phosphorylceramide glucuronosyltransferase 1 [Helianthus annuus]KAF5795547.1 putative glucuronosyltransferase [Helianthus annuus]KAJ0539036.1 putative glucuronosyltransferase [Helianthus annuus]KAJ0547089.1 putative glucuronosyltransferase [Helianthus annuus]KAJ0553674.1 putative glucuronosyltransferase [Helianthus annuus]KAJ0719335.1 putative glucuronosyltransferase [Helianthus annuus]
MKLSLVWKLGFGLILLLAVINQYVQAAPASGSSSREAYVTLLYGDEFLLGVRVLGKSIRDTKTARDMVVLVSDGVSTYAKKLLKADGWIVTPISLLQNPNQVRPTRFWGVYTKLKIFNMTDYKKVVYLDADTIVVKNIDDLFKCGKFCANLKHSERLNSGVMVVEPSEELFKDMVSKVTTLYSYTGGDQGFLNTYYAGFESARVFDPNISPEELKSKPVPEMERLSTLYNADVGLYMLANKWMVDEKELRVIHYTLGPLKPWDWWTSWLLKPVDVWQNIRDQLEETLPGTRGGRNPHDEFIVKFLFLLPLLTLLFCYYRSSLQTRSLCDHARHIYYKIKSGGTLSYSAVSSSTVNSSQQFSNGAHAKVPAFLGGVSIFFCFLAALVALAIAGSVVPRQVKPWTGLLLMYEWTFTGFFLLFGGYLHLIYKWGKMVANQGGSSRTGPLDYDSEKGHQRQVACDMATWYYGLGMAFFAIATPSVPHILGITALFARLGLMVAGGLVFASFVTYASEHLAIRSFVRGLEDKDTSRTRNSCFLC